MVGSEMNTLITNRLRVLIVAFLFLLTACNGQDTPTPSPPSQELTALPTTAPVPEDVTTDKVVVLTASAITTLDPYRMVTHRPEESVAAHLWDALVWINEDLEPEPWLAESWNLINDYTWEFTLRQEVTFHNGEPFDARAVAFSLERISSLEGSVETFAEDVGLKAVEVVDDYTVRLSTEEADASLVYKLAGVEIVPPGYYDEIPNEELARAPIGSGPYRLVSWDPTGQLVLEANPDYWRGAPTIKTLIFATEPDLDRRLEALARGEAHIISDLTPDRVAEAETGNTHLVAIEGLRRLFIGIRAEAGTPLADVKVRQALNYAVSVEAIIQNLMAGYGQRYGSWVNPPHDNSALLPWIYDSERAKSLLKEAGYPDGFKIAMDMPIGRYYRGQEIAQAVAADLAAIGIEVEIHTYEWSTYVQRLLSKNTAPLFLLSLQSQGEGIEDTANLSFVFPFNPSLWFNAEFEDLLKKARGTFNAQQRRDLLYQAQAVAYDEAPWIWLWRPYEFYGVSNELDWTPRADGLIYLYEPTTSE
jgi:peptide/nickel transport system substrate-binding protein